MYSDESFLKQIDDFLQGKSDRYNDLFVCNTPKVIINLGFPQLPMLYTKKHLKDAIHPKEPKGQEKHHYHGIKIGQLKRLPRLLNKPVMIFKSKTEKNSIVLVTNEFDDDKAPIIAAIKMNGKGIYQNREQPSNFIVSIYGKDNQFVLFIKEAIKTQKLLYVNIKKSRRLLSVLQLQSSQGLSNVDFKYILSHLISFVNTQNQLNLKQEEINMNEQEIIAQIEAKLRQEFEEKFQRMEQKFSNLAEQVHIINKFMAAMTEAQSFEQTMSEIESVTKQLTDCDKATFYCYDNSNDKFFCHGDYRNWQDEQIKDELREAFETQEILSDNKSAVIPLVSSSGDSLGVIVAEKEKGFTKEDYDNFRKGCQVVNTVELALKKEFEHQGRITDELTHLKNRQGLNEYVADTVCGRINQDKPVNIVMCDIDHFKSVNDTYGHDAGDIILKNVAHILQEGTRTGSDCAFRFGGEEMILVLNCEPEQAYAIAERLRSEVEKTVHTITADGQEKNISVTVSMGVYQMSPSIDMTPENARNVFDIEFKNADELVYKAKETGRNKVVTTPDIYASYLSQQSAEIICGSNKEAVNKIKADVLSCIENDANATVVEALAVSAEERPETAEQAAAISEKIANADKSTHNPKPRYEIFGNISFNNIADKESLCNIPADQISKLCDELKKEGLLYSGIKQENGKYTITVDGWDDLKTVRDIFKQIDGVEKDMYGIPCQNYSISDLHNSIAMTIANLNHGWDADICNEVMNALAHNDFQKVEEIMHDNMPDNPTSDDLMSINNTKKYITELTERMELPRIIGNTNYKDISDKIFINADPKTIWQLSVKAREDNVSFSGKLHGDKSVLTVSGNDEKAQKFLAEIQKISNWADKTQVKAAERRSELNEHSKQNNIDR